jgi:putative addiction module component (TIGR02574 family)
VRPEEITKEINRLELSEQLLLVEDIWDSIAADSSEIPLSESHKSALTRRYRAYKKGKLELHDWKSVHERLRDKYR